ncbi:MAG: pyrroloquinoline quinone biosynthesis protein PqqF [Pseudomonas sp.]
MSIKYLTLDNGLRVVLYHAPRLTRCAAVVRVAAGSHDVSPQWPGLAHFLEHLLFLGTDSFLADENFMTFVQRHGGQVNASTRERTTDFFFELSPSAFAPGLERLCDMLAHPRLTPADQLREREVLHAEFIAWSQDAETIFQTSLVQSVSAAHPLRAFHAGNRYSLAVQREAFQQALQDFYKRFYQAGQMILSLAGPQSLDELERLATLYGGYFAEGELQEQQAPPALQDEFSRPPAVTDPRRLNLVFACENLPESANEAVRFLCTWITDVRPGGLLFELHERGLIETLKAEPLYQFDGQLLLNVEFVLNNDSLDQRQTITALFFDWLTFFKAHWPDFHKEYALLQLRRLEISGALELARYLTVPLDGHLPVDAVLDQLHAIAVDNCPVEPIAWHLPQPNPFLREAVEEPTEGSMFLRWRLTAAHPALWYMLNSGLVNLTHAALQAGVALDFSAQGNFWQLTLKGLAEPIPLILQHALRLLTDPDSKTLARFGQSRTESPQPPIRQLLKHLADDYLDVSVAVDNVSDLSAVWAKAHWTTFSLGLPADAVDGEDLLIPGKPEQPPWDTPIRKTTNRRKAHLSDASENAVLLFCPTPGQRLADEAALRLLAHLGQPAFYQRLRVELQLGYAVFSGLRQIGGQSGWLFGVQSPSASVDELLEHMQAFIRHLPELVEACDLSAQHQALASQLDPTAMPHAQASEWLWQAYLAGRDVFYPLRLRDALLHFKKPQLLDAIDELQRASGEWLILTNRPLTR